MGETSYYPDILGDGSELGKVKCLPRFTQLVSDGAGIWTQMCLTPKSVSHSRSPPWVLLPCCCFFTPRGPCTLAVSPCLEHQLLRTCWDKSSASTSTCSFGWIFGVSPAAPRTRVRETLASCPGPRDRLAGPAFCPAHRSWKRVWTHTLLLPDEQGVQSLGHSTPLSAESNDLGLGSWCTNGLESSALFTSCPSPG